MKRREVLLAAIAGVMLAVGCSTTKPGDGADPTARRRELNASADSALSALYDSVDGSKELAAKARGVLVLPRVVSAGFVVGGTYGEGVLRKGPSTTAYYSVSAASVGLLAGAQSKSIYVLFMTPEALAKFEDSKGWTVGADASVVLVNAGANAHVDSKTIQAPVIGYVRSTGGLMANVSIDGTKFNKLDL